MGCSSGSESKWHSGAQISRSGTWYHCGEKSQGRGKSFCYVHQCFIHIICVLFLLLNLIPSLTSLFLTVNKTGDMLLTVPISALRTAQTVPKSISKPIPTITVHGLLATELAMDKSKGGTAWEAGPQFKEDFGDLMPLTWHPMLQALLPPVSLSLLEIQKKKHSSDWTIVSSAFHTLSYDVYLYNWLVVSTRTFYYTSQTTKTRKPINRDECLALVPAADYFNHAEVGCEVAFSPSGYNICANRQIEKGEEICVSYGHHSNDFLLTEYGFILDNNKWDEISLDDALLPFFSEEQKHELKAAGFFGKFVLDAETVCYRAQLALRLLCVTSTSKWQQLVAHGLGDEDKYQEVVNTILVKALKNYLERVHERLTQLEVLPCGLSNQRDILSRRWKQIRRLLTIAIIRIENSSS